MRRAQHTFRKNDDVQNPGKSMSKQPETFGLDRLHTPIGTALLVTDADGVLRALDWEDYEARMKDLLRLQYGAVVLKAARAPAKTRAALTGLFQGRSRSPE